MFKKILIANRGEIACRVVRTAKAMGIKTVAVYSDVDRDALHVQVADQSVRLGPAPAVDSYLRGDLIIQAALDTGAEAIHPGYGFLSENPDFVEAVEAAGLTFIGPSAKAIRAMGLKDAAKGLMEKAGVPVVPGYHGAEQDTATLSEKAEAIGYPVLIKAVAGGGGKGMRLVESAGDFVNALGSARAEAKSAFGNDDVLVEKYITTPRHIEVQVFGDGKRAVHLYERDCSMQRRHQKVVEEAPAPGMTEKVRRAMGDAAVRAAEAIGYSGAGTIEFIVDGQNGLREDGFWFMEMNTRLQVEHPVTEAVTGIDLVEWQLRVAAGETLPASQTEIALNGHAVEARIYAEDVPAGFLPATGQIDHLSFPDDARVDSGIIQGSVVSPWYDPMIAKVTTFGKTRTEALQKLEVSLAKTEIAGITTNLNFLQRLITDPDFASASLDTGLIERKQLSLAAPVSPTAETLALATCIANEIDLSNAHSGFALWQPLEFTQTLNVGNISHVIRYQIVNGSIHFETEIGSGVLERIQGNWWANGTKLSTAILSNDRVSVFGRDAISFEISDPLDRNQAASGGDDVRAPMPGLLQMVHVEAGALVKEGDPLAVLEAMKMEHVLRAPRDGTVEAVLSNKGDQVDAGAALITLEIET